MRSIAHICLTIATLLLIVAVAFQSLSLLSVLLLNRDHPADVFAENAWLVPVWIASLVVLVVAAILCRCLKYKLPLLPLLLGAAGTIMALMVALALREGLPVQYDPVSGQEVGLTGWKLTYRHLSSVFAGALIAIASLLHLLENRGDRVRRENEAYTSVYGVDTSTLDLEAEEMPDAKPTRKLKRSLRHKQNNG